MTCLAVIPARGGSKGIKGKNLLPINGKPLIGFTLEVALQLKQDGHLTEVVVSTDSVEIANVAQEFGAPVPFMRPHELAIDRSKTVDTILHALHFFESQHKTFQSILTLQPTSPQRTYDDVRLALEAFASQKSDSLISCFQDEGINQLNIYHLNSGFASPCHPDHNLGLPRQNIEPLYIRNGAIYLTSVEYVRTHHRLISEHPLMHVMPKNRSVNLDSLEDLHLLQSLMSETQ